jgi:N-methylhydantoinase B/oxoprolinase/acetone carboxylase alpha subunit
MSKPGRTAQDAQDQTPEISPFLMAILSSRLEAIIREMSNTVMKASRSAAIKNARDMSCGLLTYDHRLVCVEEAMPIHVSSLELTTKPITEHFDDIKEGDAFFNNCAYTGVTHHADMTLCTPVFIDGEPLFWTLSRSHHADTGAHVETTTDPYAATIYQEGIQLPCVRFQENFQDKQDLIRMCRTKIRVSHIWYGDYRAQVGACRVGEKRLKELADRYGKETIKAFVEAWIDYGRKRAIAAIRQLPAGTYQYQTVHDPIPGVAEDGIVIKAKVTIDPDEGMVTVDLRDNPDCVPGGVNLSEACAAGSGRIGVFNNLDPTIPHNEGSASRIKVLLRDGCVVGRPAYPAGTSNATMGVNDRLINAIQCCFTKMGEPYGMAEGGVDFSSGMAIVSGIDDRKGGGMPFINMVLVGLSGGPGLDGHDGWLTYEAPDGGGVLALDSIEVDEAMYPILFESRHIAEDSMGCGHWNGAPATQGSYYCLSEQTMTAAYCSDGDRNPSRGVIGGTDAAPALNRKRLRNGEVETLPSFHIETVQPGEAVVFRSNAGGGYGDPVRRDPARVAKDVNRRWLSPDRAKDIFKVALEQAENGIDYVVDQDRTNALRGTAV